jgi:L-threonylcarbamoyladenylate synthase
MKRTKNIPEAIKAIKGGGLVAFATETVYGLGADAGNDAAVARIFDAKGRPQFNPLIVHVSSTEKAKQLGEFNETAVKLADAFWPGPLTLVLPRVKNCPVSLLASAGLDSLAIRVPAHQQARALLEAFDGPVVAPSANPSGSISPTTPDHVAHGLDGKIDMVLDGGPCAVGVESTIISCLSEAPVILRHGGIARCDIENIVGTSADGVTVNEKNPCAPGQLTSHYAPEAAVRLEVVRPQKDETLLGFGPNAAPADWNLSPSGDLSEAAANLFAMLHEIDASGVQKIAVSPIPKQGLGEAINDRLERAAAARPQGGKDDG